MFVGTVGFVFCYCIGEEILKLLYPHHIVITSIAVVYELLTAMVLMVELSLVRVYLL
jgi:hypothetical protein